MNSIWGNKHLNKETGNIGEDYARNYLSENGFKIIKTNFSNKIGEVDIICTKNLVYHFVEVKMRRGLSFGYPRKAIDFKKINKIKNTAMSYLKSERILDKVSISFDCVEIFFDENNLKINFLENIF